MKKTDIEQLATLARIELTEEEMAGLADDISSILEYVGHINTITAGNTEKAGTESAREKSVGVLHSVLREDADPHEGGLYTEELLEAAPNRTGRYIEVKKILGGE